MTPEKLRDALDEYATLSAEEARIADGGDTNVGLHAVADKRAALADRIMAAFTRTPDFAPDGTLHDELNAKAMLAALDVCRDDLPALVDIEGPDGVVSVPIVGVSYDGLGIHFHAAEPDREVMFDWQRSNTCMGDSP